MSGLMLPAKERLTVDLPRPLSLPTIKQHPPTSLSAVKTQHPAYIRPFSPVSSQCKLVSLSNLAEDLWAPARFCVSALSSESEQVKDTGFERKKLAAFVSGGGSNFRSLHEASMQNKIFGDFVLVVSDKSACKACDYAKNNNIAVAEYPHNKVLKSGLSPVELVAVLRQFEVDIVLLAGYLKLLPNEVVQAFPRAILNIHPALLPAFGGKGYYGRKVHEAVIKSGARYSGPTVHFVDEKYDHGSIVAQRVVPVLAYDTPDDLAARVLNEEHKLYPEVVAALCEDRIFWREDNVPLIRRSWDEAEYY